jgi:hypothetical protein
MPPGHYIQDVHKQVAATRDLLSQRLGKRVWIEGVVCMTRAFVNGYQIQVAKPPTHVVFVERVLDFLETYENRRELSPADVEAIGTALDEFPRSN